MKQELYAKDSSCAICGNTIQHIDDSAVDHINRYWKAGKTIPESVHFFSTRSILADQANPTIQSTSLLSNYGHISHNAADFHHPAGHAHINTHKRCLNQFRNVAELLSGVKIGKPGNGLSLGFKCAML